ncbi:MAG: choice-of-anchor D domain-containing protein [Terriglobia bacterium]
MPGYDPQRALVIDPALGYSTYLGGSSYEYGQVIAVDSTGSAYVAGSTESTNFPTVNPIQGTLGGSWDAYVAKLNPTGSALVYSTYLGGKNADYGSAIAVDSLGDAYVTGNTASNNFPTVNPIQATLDGTQDAYVAELNPGGSGLVYSTYLGGSSTENGQGIAVDSSGNAYVTGYTNSTDFPTMNPLQLINQGNYNVFVAKLNFIASPTPLVTLVYSTYLGGSGTDYGYGIAIDSSGNAYVTGYTTSTDFPTVNPFQATNLSLASPWENVFVAKLNSTGSALLYSTYLGGGGQDIGYGIAVDSSGNAYVTGSTSSGDFPLSNPLQGYNYAVEASSNPTAFVAKLNSTGSALIYSTYLGGSVWDLGYGIAVDSFGNAYVTGRTSSTDFPIANPLQATNAGGIDAFVAELNSAGSTLVYSTYLGGSSTDVGLGIARDSSVNTYVIGNTESSKFPTTTGALQTTFGGVEDAFVAKILPGGGAYSVSFSPTSLGFGTQSLGTPSAPQTVTATNTGTANLTISFTTAAASLTALASGGANASDFATSADGCTGNTLPPDGICTVSVTFTPSSPGPRNASLFFYDNGPNMPQTISLTGTGVGTAPVVSLSPLSLGFLNQPLWITSPSMPVKLSNTGNAALTITSLATSTNFNENSNCGGSVVAGGSCTINVTFSPTATGSLTGTMTITDNSGSVPGSTQTVELTGTGVTSAPVGVVSLRNLTFSNQSAGTISAPQPVTLTNTGNAALAISSITTSGNFGQVNNCPGSLAAGGSCTISVNFSPTASGTRQGLLTITDNSYALANYEHDVFLTGTGVATGALAEVSPATLTFSNQAMGTISASQPVTLTNIGNVALAVTNISATANFGQANNCAGSVAARGSCTINVTFSPTAVGSLTGSLTITDNSKSLAGSTQTVSLSGTGTGPVASLSTTKSYGFSNQLLNTTSTTVLTETVTNTGAVLNLTFPSMPSGVTIGGTNAGDFAKSVDTCTGASVAPNGTCTVKVTFTPTATGSRSASLIFTDNSNGVAGNTQTVSLTGTGTAPLASVSPGSLTFGYQNLGSTSASQPVTLTNGGTAALTIASTTPSTNFGTTTGTSACGSSLAAGSSCKIYVTFSPASTATPGPLTGTLTITDNANAVTGSAQTVSLTGTAVTFPVAGVSPSSLIMGSHNVGTTTSTTVTLSNTGTGALFIANLATNNANFGVGTGTAACGSTLAASGSCYIYVIFSPTASGTLTGTLTITDNNNGVAGSTQTVSLSGTGSVPVIGSAAVCLTPASLTFPARPVNTPSAPQTVTLSNCGGTASTLTLTSFYVNGTNYIDFPGTTNCGSTLSGGASCTINITFTPAAAGSRSAYISITDSAANSPQTVNLAGTGSSAATNPVPFINQPLVPTSVAPGGPGFNLTVNGTGFVSGATVNWNGAALTTTFVSSQQLTATVPAANIASPGTAWVTVVNPGTALVSNLSLLSITSPLPTVTFSNASGSPVGAGTEPESVAMGDFNGDRKLDLAVINDRSNNVTILLGNGDGTFQTAVNYTVGSAPTDVAAGDFNGDGKLDLAVTNADSNNVTILLGNGNGTFTPAASSPATGTEPYAVAVGDFNGDGKLDLAVANYVSGNVTILLGNGDGTFACAASSPTTGTKPSAIAVGDFNGDGKLDLAVANYGSNNLTILLGNGDGTFSSAALSPATGTEPYSVAVGDFNGDGFADLVVANYGDTPGTASVLLNKADGTGTFQTQSKYTVGSVPTYVAVGDLNGDANLDLAVANQASNTMTIFLGNGAGTFTPAATSPATGAEPWAVVVGDFNGDGKLDLATVNFYSSNVSVLLQLPPAPVASLAPASLTFGNQNLGTMSASQPVALTNTGDATLTITSITPSANFGATYTCAGSLAAGITCTINVTFSPTATGTLTGTLTITDNSNGVTGSTQTVSLTGTGIGPSVSLSPPSVGFGSQPVGTTSAASTVTVTNNGTAALTFTSLVAMGDFALAGSGTTCSTNAPVAASGGNCVINLTFTPTTTGSRSGSLTLADNASGSLQTVSLTGTGVAANPLAGVSPGSLTFANQPLGTTSASQPVTLSNAGNAPLAITSITASTNFGATNTCAGSVAASGSCTINVTFSPTATGPLTGTLTITDNANGVTGSTQTVSLSGTWTAPAVSLSPSSLAFPAQFVGTSSTAQTVTLTNTGNASLTISSITGAWDFSQTNTCGTSVSVGAQCVISVIFNPAAAGTRTGSLSVCNNASGSPQSVALSGTGVLLTVGPHPPGLPPRRPSSPVSGQPIGVHPPSPPVHPPTPVPGPAVSLASSSTVSVPAPAVRLASSSLTFLAQSVGTSSSTQTVKLTNTGNGTLTLSGIATSDNFGQTNNCGGSIAARASCTINVTFSPTATGSLAGTLTFTYNSNGVAGSKQTVTLRGTGTNPVVRSPGLTVLPLWPPAHQLLLQPLF